MIGFMPSDIAAVSSTLPACAMIPNQQNFTRHDERFNFSTIFSDCQIGQVYVSFKSDPAQWHSSWSSFLTESYIFCIFPLFSPNFRHFAKRFRRIQSWYRFHLHDARLLADDLNFDLTFVTRNFIGSGVIRCAFWLVSRKDNCLERVLRKSFWIKKSINKIPFICRINFEKYFIKAIENFFPVFA